MNSRLMLTRGVLGLTVLFLVVALSPIAVAAPPVVKTVPWVAANALIPHDTWSGRSIRLKGTADIQGADIQYSWDFGDGTLPATGTVTNKYAIEAVHTMVARRVRRSGDAVDHRVEGG